MKTMYRLVFLFSFILRPELQFIIMQMIHLIVDEHKLSKHSCKAWTSKKITYIFICLSIVSFTAEILSSLVFCSLSLLFPAHLIYTSFLIPISNSENIYETAIFDKDLVPSYNAKIKIAITLLKFILLQFSTL